MHQHEFVKVCVWSLECNDFDGLAWDGGYTDYCPGCGLFYVEIKYPNKPDIHYAADEHFIHAMDGNEYADAKDRSKWIPVQQWRALHAKAAA